MVTLAHGGPWARDRWGFDSEVQFLASRGYAVLQLNFRGSSGYNRKISTEYSGDFRAMVDDLSDATRLAVKEGWADPDRLAIMGASFGGYAAVASAAFDPDLYKCAVSIAGTFDIEKQIKNWKTRFWRSVQGTSAYDHWIEKLGDPAEEADYIHSISPINHLAEVKAPILLIHGKEDRVVSQKQSKDLAKELKRAGKEVETLYLKWERHSLDDLNSKIKAYSAIEAFLEENLR
jgi:dipeptidyl aminopeptidase/acylaminoacyl peptidase